MFDFVYIMPHRGPVKPRQYAEAPLPLPMLLRLQLQLLLLLLLQLPYPCGPWPSVVPFAVGFCRSPCTEKAEITTDHTERTDTSTPTRSTKA